MLEEGEEEEVLLFYIVISQLIQDQTDHRIDCH